VPGELETGLRVRRVDPWKGTPGDVADEVSILAEPHLVRISSRRFDVGRARRQISGLLRANLQLSALNLVEELDGQETLGAWPMPLGKHRWHFRYCGGLLVREERPFDIVRDVCTRSQGARARGEHCGHDRHDGNSHAVSQWQVLKIRAAPRQRSQLAAPPLLA